MSRRRSERGASVVEFALIANILALLFVGIVDFGSIYSDQIAIRQGAREGARQVVKAKGDTAAYSCSSLTTGDFSGGAQSARDRRIFCMVKDRVDLDDTDVRVAIRFEGGSHAAGKSVAVCVAYPAESLTGFFSALLNDKAITTRTQMRVEKLYGTTTPPTQTLTNGLEEAYPFRESATQAQRNADWSWCVAQNTQTL